MNIRKMMKQAQEVQERMQREIAAIADNLLLPGDVIERITGLQQARQPRLPGFVFG